MKYSILILKFDSEKNKKKYILVLRYIFLFSCMFQCLHLFLVTIVKEEEKEFCLLIRGFSDQTFQLIGLLNCRLFFDFLCVKDIFFYKSIRF